MGKLLKFPGPENSNLMKLKETSDRIDDLVLNAICENGVDPYEMAGILAHRLGVLIRNLDNNPALLRVCEKVLKKQAAVK